MQLICEASGGYERPVLAALAAAGVTSAVVDGVTLRQKMNELIAALRK